MKYAEKRKKELNPKGNKVTRGSRLADVMLGLTQQEALFCVEYIKDFNEVRAGEMVGIHPDKAVKLKDTRNVKDAVDRLLQVRLKDAVVDAEWVLGELKDNHYLARHQGNIAASNKALDQLAKHCNVDAYAAEKVDMDTRLQVVVKQYGETIDQKAEVLDEGGGGQSSDDHTAISFL